MITRVVCMQETAWEVPKGKGTGPMAESTRGALSNSHVQRLKREDLVGVAPSDRRHMPLVQAMRKWRKASAAH